MLTNKNYENELAKHIHVDKQEQYMKMKYDLYLK